MVEHESADLNGVLRVCNIQNPESTVRHCDIGYRILNIHASGGSAILSRIVSNDLRVCGISDIDDEKSARPVRKICVMS